MWERLILILRRRGWLLLLLVCATTLGEQFLTTKIEVELSSMDGASGWIWVDGIFSMLIGFLQPSLLLLICLACLRSKSEQSLESDFFKSFSALLKETIRAAGISLWWGFLLIIPGLIRFLQFSFVPFVVFLDPAYQRGEKDALKESTRLVNKRFFVVLCILITFTVVVPLALSSLDEWSLLLRHPFSGVLLCGLDVVLSVLSVLLLLRQWEKTHGTDFQLAGH